MARVLSSRVDARYSRARAMQTHTISERAGIVNLAAGKKVYFFYDSWRRLMGKDFRVVCI
jgi:hypothetical protein